MTKPTTWPQTPKEYNDKINTLVDMLVVFFELKPSAMKCVNRDQLSKLYRVTCRFSTKAQVECALREAKRVIAGGRRRFR